MNRSMVRFLLGSALAAPSLLAQLGSNCTVSIGPITAPVQADGSWHLDNVNSSYPILAVRADCVQGNAIVSGVSASLPRLGNVTVGVPPIQLGSALVPNSLTVSAPVTKLTAPNQVVNLQTMGNFNLGSPQDLTKASTGTVYLVSNSKLATVSADGAVTALASGTVLVQAINSGAQGYVQLSILLSGDSDGDGIPDDVEIANGLDPNNPADAMDDPDHDGLTNLQEFKAGTDMHNPDTDGDGLTDGQEVNIFHTNPLLKDTDGDGVPDNIEIATGSDPTNPGSFNLAAALQDIRVSPTAFTITGAGGPGSGTQQLTVTGDFKLGGTIDLTLRARQTIYTSNNTPVCNFGTADGLVLSQANGTCVITVTNNGFTATSTGTVSNFAQSVISRLDLPGYPNGVDAVGNFAYVASGSAGLVIVNIANMASPQIAATLALPGNANAVRVAGKYAFVAGGVAGLQIVDVSNPAAPALLSSVVTPGFALGLSMFENHVYVAAADAGLVIVDVTSPANPNVVATVDTPGRARSVAMLQKANGPLYALVVDGRLNGVETTTPPPAVQVIDVTNPAASAIVATGSMASLIIDAVALDLFNATAYISGTSEFNGGNLIDFTDPLHPRVFTYQTGRNGFEERADMKVAGKYTIYPDQFSGNAAYFSDVSGGFSSLSFTEKMINVAPLFPAGTQHNTGALAAKGPFLFISYTDSRDSAFPEKGIAATNAPAGLVIAEYLPAADTAGVAPAVTLTEPAANSTVIAGSTISVRATASDDVAIGSVTFQVNGADVFTDDSQPFEMFYTVPANATSLTFTARATDLGGNATTTPVTTVTVVADPLTTIHGRVVGADGSPIPGAAVTCLTSNVTTDSAGMFNIPAFPTLNGTVSCSATATLNGRTVRGNSAAVAVIAGSTTSIADITVKDFAHVLMITDQITQTTESIFKSLQDAGAAVTLRPPPQTTWDSTNPALAGFDCVVHLSGEAPPPVFPLAAQQALVSFVRAGGGYIGFAANNSDDGVTTAVMHDLTLFPGTFTSAVPPAGQQSNVTYSKVAGQETHPIIAGLPGSFTFVTQEPFASSNAGAFFPFTETPPTDLLTQSLGGTLVHALAVRQLGSGRVVRFSIAENRNPAITVYPDGTLMQLVVNSAGWACGHQ